MSNKRDAIITQVKRPAANPIRVDQIIVENAPEQELSVKYERSRESFEISEAPLNVKQTSVNAPSSVHKTKDDKRKPNKYDSSNEKSSSVCNFLRAIFGCCRSQVDNVQPNGNAEIRHSQDNLNHEASTLEISRQLTVTESIPITPIQPAVPLQPPPVVQLPPAVQPPPVQITLATPTSPPAPSSTASSSTAGVAVIIVAAPPPSTISEVSERYHPSSTAGSLDDNTHDTWPPSLPYSVPITSNNYNNNNNRNNYNNNNNENVIIFHPAADNESTTLTAATSTITPYSDATDTDSYIPVRTRHSFTQLNYAVEERESCYSTSSHRQSSMESLIDEDARDAIMSEDVEEYGGQFLGELSVQDYGKICLVLDLDETLVHSSFEPVEPCDFTVDVDIDGELHPVYVCKRPFVDQFLQTVAPLFECVLFTASLSKYADPVTDQLDPYHNIFRHRLFRESCHYYQGNYVKNLDDLGRSIERVVILDNSPVCYCFHPHNAIPICSWFDDPTDNVLLQLIDYMQRMSSATDVVAFLETNDPPGLELLSDHDREMVSGVGNTVFSRPVRNV